MSDTWSGKLSDNSWKLSDNSWKLSDNSWKLSDNSWKLSDNSWKLSELSDTAEVVRDLKQGGKCVWQLPTLRLEAVRQCPTTSN